MITQMTITNRPYAGEADLQPVCDLLNLCDSVDHLEEGFMTAESMRVWMDDPEVEPERDVHLWLDRDGRLVGYARTWIPKDPVEGEQDSHLFFRVHPDTRNQGIEEAIFEWGTGRVRPIGQERGLPAHMRTGLHYSTPEYIAYREDVLDRNGFRPVRYGYKMARPLNEPIPEPQFPEGITVRPAGGEAEAEKWTEMFNQTFIDHWNHTDWTVESYINWLKRPHYRQDIDLLAVAPDGTFAGFCVCFIDVDDNRANKRSEGWIDILGTRRGFRKIGLGKALLLQGMKVLKAEGIEVAVLGVDAENPTGALGLYESVGFYPVMKTGTYRKDL